MRVSVLGIAASITAALAAGDPWDLLSKDIHRVLDFEQITPSDLERYSVIFVKGDNSLILSSDYYRQNKDKTKSGFLSFLNPKKLRDKWRKEKKFTQIKYYTDTSGGDSAETFPLDGCFDNRFSDTISMVQRSYEKIHSKTSQFGLVGGLMAYNLQGSASVGDVEVFEEKLICTIEPGQRLQFSATLVKKKVILKSQRDVSVTKGVIKEQTIFVSEWESVKGPVNLELVLKSLACVTDEHLLRC